MKNWIEIILPFLPANVKQLKMVAFIVANDLSLDFKIALGIGLGMFVK